MNLWPPSIRSGLNFIRGRWTTPGWPVAKPRPAWTVSPPTAPAGCANRSRPKPDMPYLSFQNITKRFPGVLALDGVSFEVERGSCHALIGENGAGKSTLGKILAGVYVADEGEILLDGQPINAPTPLAARQLGIAMVHQELAFCPNLSVAENLCLGDLPRRAGWLQRGVMRQ